MVCRIDGQLMFNDIYIYVTGEHLSETLQRFLIKSVPSKNPMKRLFGNDKKVDVDNFLLARAMVDKGEFQNAYNEMDKISGELAKEKFILLFKSGIAAEISNELYEKNLAEFTDLFPEDPTLYLKLIDYNILKENYRKANENIDKLIFETEDNFLRIMKAKICLLDGDYETAENHYNYMMEYYPDFFESYIGAMITLNYLNRFNEALNIADNLIEMGYDKDILAEFFEEKDEFGENVLDPLVKSKPYKKWKRKS